MGSTKGVEDFKKYINAPTKKDPRLDPSTEHDEAFEDIKAKGPKIKAKIKGQVKF